MKKMWSLVKIVGAAMALCTLLGGAGTAFASEENIALRDGIIVISDGTATYNSTKVENAFDGDLSTKWQISSNAAANRWIGIDAGEGETITFNKVTMYEEAAGETSAVPGYRLTGYKIEVSDDLQNWTTVAGGTTIGEGPVDIRFATQTARAVRFYTIGAVNNFPVILKEMEVYYDESYIPANIAQREGITYIGTEGGGAAGYMKNAFDSMESTYWQSAGTPGAGRRLGIDAGEGNTITFNKIVLSEYAETDGTYRLTGYRIDVTNDDPGTTANGGTWTTIAEGTTIGAEAAEIYLDKPQTARAVRFYCTGTEPTAKTPKIAEMGIYYDEAAEDGSISINEDSQYILGDDNSVSNIAIGTMVEEFFAHISLNDENAVIGVYSAEGEEKMPDAYVMDNDVMKVIGSETTEFTLKLAEVVYTDAAKVTDAKDYLTKSEMSITPGMTIRASALANNGKLILAYYDSDNKLAGCVYGEAVSGYDNLVSAELVIPADKEGCFAKAFVWDDMLPLAGVANIE